MRAIDSNRHDHRKDRQHTHTHTTETKPNDAAMQRCPTILTTTKSPHKIAIAIPRYTAENVFACGHGASENWPLPGISSESAPSYAKIQPIEHI